MTDIVWAVAPTLPVAQAIGRLGNWFNQELYGRPSTLPWALRIDPAHRPAASPLATTYQPTFLYELLWDLGVAVLVVWAQRRFRLSGWASFALYAAAYTLGRGWIEALRDDHANHLLGLRINDWTSILVFLAALTALAVLRRQPPPGTFTAHPVEAGPPSAGTGNGTDTPAGPGPRTAPADTGSDPSPPDRVRPARRAGDPPAPTRRRPARRCRPSVRGTQPPAGIGR